MGADEFYEYGYDDFTYSSLDEQGKRPDKQTKEDIDYSNLQILFEQDLSLPNFYHLNDVGSRLLSLPHQMLKLKFSNGLLSLLAFVFIVIGLFGFQLYKIPLYCIGFFFLGYIFFFVLKIVHTTIAYIYYRREITLLNSNSNAIYDYITQLEKNYYWYKREKVFFSL